MKLQKTNLFAPILFTLLFSCKTNEPIKAINESIKNYTLNDKSKALIEIEEVSNEIEAIGRIIIKNKNGTPNMSGFIDCAKISWTNAPEGRIVELVFEKSKICSDGKTRSGKLIIAYNQTDYDTIVIPERYIVNGVIVNGNFSIDYTTADSQAANLVVTNGSIRREDKALIEFNLSKTSTINDNHTILKYKNATYFINLWSGNSHSFIKAVALTSSTLNYTCSNFRPISGSVKIDYSSSGTSPTSLTGINYLNFGNGTCGTNPYLENYTR